MGKWGGGGRGVGSDWVGGGGRRRERMIEEWTQHRELEVS